ncbi:2Fe-2S iron-sulfur cluster-binding protein [Pelagicoccus sp. SDUM812003]|uniref:2Fe-2S iron-sulfur cluster-binding protein n=1 Tax=Pelagicoccus sp. SDUM812003 TaxID=3041267 RepID=UPI00280DFCCC|nr:2Fe-2S iron-sulfur cluster-binding protein [Pelagicoccus sp. SDUM812003]MDQ8202648.1 2Fe-2S iron-sulfur cluster-binding protein [Pelagicoccus sp. SDUM812003]
MAEEKKDNLITVNIDGIDLQVPPGTNMVDAVKMLGKEVPHYCYHPKLSVAGNCRMCLVEMGMPGKDRATGEPMLNEDGSPKIMWMPGPAIACGTKAAPGMHIKTNSPKAVESREAVTEFLLINHPLDCPICDQAGECKLQEFSASHGRGYSRFIEAKNVKPKRTRLGPRVTLDDERCILCSRCVRFSQEIAKDDVLGFIDRGSYSTLTCFPGKELANNYSLNTVDICPVGALTSTDFRFKMRVWFLKETKSIDLETSVGCNTVVSSREGKIYRITPRQNDEVNDTWMPDSGRELYKQVEAEDRLTGCVADSVAIEPSRAIAAAADALKGEGIAIVGSGRCTVEEQFALKAIADQVGAKDVYLVARYGEDDGILVSKDRNPNVRGALATGLISDLPTETLSDLAAKIDAGEVKTVFAVREDLVAAGLSEDQLAKVTVIALDTRETPTTKAAKVTIAGLTQFEKSGSVINQQFRIQKFHKAVPGPSGAIDDLAALAGIQSALSSDAFPNSVGTIWERIAASGSLFEGLSFKGISDTGVLLDGSSFEGLPFVEGKSLHFEPKSEAVAAE